MFYPRKKCDKRCNTNGAQKLITIKDLQKPKLPYPIQAFNLCELLYSPQQLTVEEIISIAQKRTKLQLFLDEQKYPFRDGLARLVADYNDKKNCLSLFGKFCLKRIFARMASNNLMIAHRIRKYPEILSEEIKSPVFIIGPPRTGTSHLHDTLAQHPLFRTPKHVELVLPVLKEEYFTSLEKDPRYQWCNAYLKFTQYLRPYLPLLHDLGADCSEEDIFINGIIFRSIIYGMMFPCNEYTKWLGDVDHIPVYEVLKITLQLLQWQDFQMGHPRRCWLLKSPDHSFSLPALKKVFPDATIIQTHRDMNAVLPSYLNLIVYTHGIFNHTIDLKRTAEWWLSWFEFILSRLIKDQKHIKGQYSLFMSKFLGHHLVFCAGIVRLDCVINVLFSDLVSDDLAVVLHVLSGLDVSVDEETLHTLKNYVMGHKRHAKGRILYQGNIFGLKDQVTKNTFKSYHKEFGLLLD